MIPADTLEQKQQQVSELGGVDLDIVKTWDYKKLDLMHFALTDLDANAMHAEGELPESEENDTL